MVRFINGGVNSDREKLMFDSICESVSSGRQVIVIIPDQFSFEYDKKLYNRLGAVRFNKITTAGFNRLAELLSKQYGNSGSSDLADENAKIVFMYKAVKTLRKSKKLGYYTALADKNGIENGNFISATMPGRRVSYVGWGTQMSIASEQTNSVRSSPPLNGPMHQRMAMASLPSADLNVRAKSSCALNPELREKVS